MCAHALYFYRRVADMRRTDLRRTDLWGDFTPPVRAFLDARADLCFNVLPPLPVRSFKISLRAFS
jgi:hypothetical protein